METCFEFGSYSYPDKMIGNPNGCKSYAEPESIFPSTFICVKIEIQLTWENTFKTLKLWLFPWYSLGQLCTLWTFVAHFSDVTTKFSMVGHCMVKSWINSRKPINQAFSIDILKILVGHWPTWPSYCDAPAWVLYVPWNTR